MSSPEPSSDVAGMSPEAASPASDFFAIPNDPDAPEDDESPHNTSPPAAAKTLRDPVVFTPLQAKKRDGPSKDRKVNREPGITSKVIGHIKGVKVGTTWAGRHECSEAGVHGPTTAGMHGNAEVGLFSIAMSGGYADDEDHGETFIYTGCGGRNRLTGEQHADQTWDGRNRWFKLSQSNGNPVRVVRGSGAHSRYGPAEGYRYDGLYRVVETWIADGASNFKTCRAKFERYRPDTSRRSPVASTSSMTIDAQDESSGDEDDYVVPRRPPKQARRPNPATGKDDQGRPRPKITAKRNASNATQFGKRCWDEDSDQDALLDEQDAKRHLLLKRAKLESNAASEPVVIKREPIDNGAQPGSRFH